MDKEREQKLSHREQFIAAGQSAVASFIEGKELTNTEKQKTLGEMWEILSVLYPEDRTGTVDLKIPSERLIELGLVSEKKAQEILKRKGRKETLGINPQDEPLNIITIWKDKPNGKFTMSKTYMTEDQFFAKEGKFLLRMDTLIKEKSSLGYSETDGKYYFQMETGEVRDHLHALGKTWIPNETEGEGLQLTKVTSRDITRTLVLLVEGTFPNCLTPLKTASK